MDNGDTHSGYSQIGGWFLPAASGSFCTSATSSFTGGPSLPTGHGYCERYSSLRSHRPAPYTSPYGQRNTSPSHYMDNSSTFSMLPAPDSWSSLGLPPSSGVLPPPPSSQSTQSQFTSLWSLGSSTSPNPAASQGSSGSQFLRGSPTSYTSIPSAIQTPSASPCYDGTLTQPASESQFDATIARLASSWATATQTY